jgi:hypothetical protein
MTNDPRKRFGARQQASTGGTNREPNGARAAECGELGHDARACEGADGYFTLAQSRGIITRDEMLLRYSDAFARCMSNERAVRRRQDRAAKVS